MNTSALKDYLIFFGGVALLISSVLPAALAAKIVVNNTGSESLALLAAIIAGGTYLLTMGFLYGKYVIYPNEGPTDGI